MTPEQLTKANEIIKEIEQIELFFSNLDSKELIRLRRDNYVQLPNEKMSNLSKEFYIGKSTHDALIKCLKEHLELLKNEFAKL